jgi:hypothetical protein
MKIRPVVAQFFHADRRTDGRTNMTKLVVAFRNFVNASENGPDKNVDSIRLSEFRGQGRVFAKDVRVLQAYGRVFLLSWDMAPLIKQNYSVQWCMINLDVLEGK